jgi:beta-glucosidase
MAGDEVVQLYIRDEISSVMRPWKQLKGFERVHLAPGETETVTFEVGWEALCFYGMDDRWTVEPGEFTLMIGRHAYEDVLQTTLIVT